AHIARLLSVCDAYLPALALGDRLALPAVEQLHFQKIEGVFLINSQLQARIVAFEREHCGRELVRRNGPQIYEFLARRLHHLYLALNVAGYNSLHLMAFGNICVPRDPASDRADIERGIAGPLAHSDGEPIARANGELRCG